MIIGGFILLLCASFSVGFDVLRDEDGVSVTWPRRSIAVFVESKPHGTMTASQIATVTRRAIDVLNGGIAGDTALADKTSSKAKTRLIWGGLVADDPRFDIFIRMATDGFSARAQNPTARLRLDAKAGVLRRVRIELDAQHFNFSQSAVVAAKPTADLQAVLTSQLGHALGLGFSRDRDSALYYLVIARSQRRLSEDDRRGLRWLYDKDKIATDKLKSGRPCDACEGDNDCAGTCLTWPEGGSYCVDACDDHNDCAIGYSCGTWPGGRACLPNDRHCAPDLAQVAVSGRCANDLACPDRLFCLATENDGFCTAGCSGFCGDFGQCRQVQLGSQVVGLCLLSQNRAFGTPCEVAPDCASLTCAPSIHGGGRCTRACASGCPKGAACDADGQFCVQAGTLALGWPCKSGFDCASSLCLELGAAEGRVCASTCSAPSDCPTGSGCAPSAKGMFCVPFGQPPAGAPCTTPGACGQGSLCDVSGMAGVGRCAPTCDPFSVVATCPASMRCAWVGQTSETLGACRPSGSGTLTGKPCDATTSCRVDLICAAAAEGGGVCRRACAQAKQQQGQDQEQGCANGATCVQLTGADQPSVCTTSATASLRQLPPKIERSVPNFAARPINLSKLKAFTPPTSKAAPPSGCSSTMQPSHQPLPNQLYALFIGLLALFLRRVTYR